MLFNKAGFNKYQKILTVFANSDIGKSVLGIDGDKSSLSDEKIDFILPHAIGHIHRNWAGKPLAVTMEFRTNEKFARRLYFKGLPVWKLFHKWDMGFANIFVPQLNLGFDAFPSEPLFPAAGANSPMDGQCERNAVNETYANIRTGAGTANDGATQATLTCYLQSSATTDQFVENIRVIVCFDTSAIPDTATIDAATFSGYFHAKTNQLGSPDFHLAGATPASTSSIASADYGQCQTTSFGNITYANFTADQYNDIILNASGLAAISKIAVTSFSLQQSWDINASFGGVWGSGLNTTLEIKSADTAGTSNDPKLTGTYTLATVGVDMWHPAPFAGYGYKDEIVGY